MTPTQQRKRPVKRAFQGLAGRPQDEPVPPTASCLQKDVKAKPIQNNQKIKVPVEKAYCLIHAKPRPCATCFYDEQGDIKFAERREAVKALNDILQQEWAKIAKSSGIRPDQKCVHGMYLAEHYCEVCRFEPIDPNYNPEIYRTEIRKALGLASAILKCKDEEGRIDDEGWKDLEDLKRLVDIEIWKATKYYGDKMNAAIAYTVAKNTAGAFLADRIEEQTILVVDSDGNPVLDEFGQAEGLNGAELKKKSEDLNITPEERKEAKKKLERYAERIPRFTSMDDRPDNEEGDDLGTTKAELAAIGGPVQGDDEFSAIDIESLQRLAATWHGDKRRVAEAMLMPDFTVRGVPGLDKSKVSRIRSVVVRAFKALINRDLKVLQK